ncbi:MAG: sn-glycerol-3-phosphate import ATP-binding protein UgpC [Burkholderiaceae bacterium]
MATVKLDAVRKSYGNTEVVHGVSVDITDGEFIVIVGPSGCGKSTLLRMVAGLETITAGEISIDGRVVNTEEPKDRNIAMVFQNYALYPHMTVYDNMAYGLKIAGLSKAQIRERIDKSAAMLQLGEYLDRKPSALSGGQRQRVAMGRALVREPAAFLLDEPLSNLDAKLRVQMRLEIREMQQTVGVTSLYVTHDQVEAMTLADRLIVMNAGVAEQIDSPLAVYEKPATRFVAGFIGSPAMNIWPVRRASGSGVVELPGPVRLSADIAHPASGECDLGIRPEHLQVVGAEQADVALEVKAIERLGADTLAHGVIVPAQQTGSLDTPSVNLTEPPADAVVRIPGTEQIKLGQRLGLKFDQSVLHWFDRQSGQRIGVT